MVKQKQSAQNSNQVQLQMHGQFVKELSFIRNEINNTESVQPKVDVNIDISPELVNADQKAYHINLTVSVKASVEDKEAFVIKLVHTGLFMVDVADDNIREQVLNIKCPEVLFPYTSRQIADITRDGGFPPMMIGLVNFAEIYQKKQGVDADGDKTAVNGEAVDTEVVN